MVPCRRGAKLQSCLDLIRQSGLKLEDFIALQTFRSPVPASNISDGALINRRHHLLGDDGHVSLQIVVQIKGRARGVEDSDGSHFEGIDLSLKVHKTDKMPVK